jgi:hypothetical protein
MLSMVGICLGRVEYVCHNNNSINGVFYQVLSHILPNVTKYMN